MGWDCWATKDGARLVINWNDHSRPYMEDESVANVFSHAAQAIIDEYGQVDGWLRLGGLDCSVCAEMIERATGQDCWSEEDWSAELTRSIQLSADWSFAADPEEMWAYLSAKTFLDICTSMGFGIEFSW